MLTSIALAASTFLTSRSAVDALLKQIYPYIYFLVRWPSCADFLKQLCLNFARLWLLITKYAQALLWSKPQRLPDDPDVFFPCDGFFSIWIFIMFSCWNYIRVRLGLHCSVVVWFPIRYASDPPIGDMCWTGGWTQPKFLMETLCDLEMI